MTPSHFAQYLVLSFRMPLHSDSNVAEVLALVETVLSRPACHPKLVGNSALSISELGYLKAQWERRDELVAARHPVPLTEIFSQDAELEAEELLASEGAESWQDLSRRGATHTQRGDEIDQNQSRYLRLCDQLGIVYSPLLKVRRAQLQAVLALGALGASIPRAWWGRDATPVLSVANWKAHFQACATHAKGAPLPLHFIALEGVAETHWIHVEAKAEHGFNMVSYCLNFVNDRKCKYALRQVFPSIPPRGFKQWQEVTLHAVTALRTVVSLRSASESHVVLKQLASSYLAVAHESPDHAEKYLTHDDVRKLEKAAALVEQMRARNDLFEVGSPHWQTFWESPNPTLLSQVEALQSELDSLALPNKQADNLEDALKFYEAASRRIQSFRAAVQPPKQGSR